MTQSSQLNPNKFNSKKDCNEQFPDYLKIIPRDKIKKLFVYLDVPSLVLRNRTTREHS